MYKSIRVLVGITALALAIPACGSPSTTAEPAQGDSTTPIPNIVKLPSGAMQVTFEGQPGDSYAIEVTSDLSMSNWTTLAVVTADKSGKVVYVDNDAVNASIRFYRIKLAN